MRHCAVRLQTAKPGGNRKRRKGRRTHSGLLADLANQDHGEAGREQQGLEDTRSSSNSPPAVDSSARVVVTGEETQIHSTLETAPAVRTAEASGRRHQDGGRSALGLLSCARGKHGRPLMSRPLPAMSTRSPMCGL